ncbi:MAG: 30S ribosomal protein S20 [Deltaproteobacteria bacterium CG11_big_fil_rev_8_21_14_0_20_47_16]|nr:MAG: 30S ribosomal protein S20 [Deltaproteobacteria bacterium CG11_big_fil_rev_8_21_14_0_20_47_16]
MAAEAPKKKKLIKGRHASAIKRAKQAEVRSIRNRHVMSTMRNAVKSVRNAIGSKDKAAAQKALKQAVPVIDKTVSKGVIPKVRASRMVSRLTVAVASL